MIAHLIHAFGYFAIFVLMTLESVFIPIPSEVTMPFAGFLASRGVFSLWIVVLVGALGNLVGSLIGYYIGFVLEEHVLLGWIRRYGKYVLLTEADYHRGAVWFEKYGNTAVFSSRLLPAVRTFISLPAGMFRMNLWRFSIYTFAGSLIWSALLAYAGFYLGNQWMGIDHLLRGFGYLVVAAVVLAVGYYLIKRLRKPRDA